MLFPNRGLFAKVNILILVRYSLPLCWTDMAARYAIAYQHVERVNPVPELFDWVSWGLE